MTIIGDNFAVNLSLANNVGCHFIGYASHWFNIALKDKIKANKDLFQKVQALIKKVKYGLLTTRLRKTNPCYAVLMNKTLW